MAKTNKNIGVFKSVKIGVGTAITVLQTAASTIDSIAELVTIQLEALIVDSKASAIKDSGLHLANCIRELAEEYQDILENEEEYMWPMLIAPLNTGVKQLQVYGNTDTQITFSIPNKEEVK